MHGVARVAEATIRPGVGKTASEQGGQATVERVARERNGRQRPMRVMAERQQRVEGRARQ